MCVRESAKEKERERESMNMLAILSALQLQCISIETLTRYCSLITVQYRLDIDIAGWRRPIGYFELQVIFRNRATRHRALLQNMTRYCTLITANSSPGGVSSLAGSPKKNPEEWDPPRSTWYKFFEGSPLPWLGNLPNQKKPRGVGFPGINVCVCA